MSSERAEQPTTPDNQHGIPGKTLAAHREAMGWSVEQVADQLKLAVRQVVALEAGDYGSLPSPAVTRGFVRAYAKLMKLDPVPLVAQIEMDVPAAADLSATTAATRRPAPASFSESRFPLHGKRSSLPLGWIAGAVVVVAAAAAAWHFGVVPMRSSEQAAPAANGTNGASATVATSVATDSANGSTVETLQNPSVPLISVPSPNSAAPAAAPVAAASAPGPVVNVPNTSATGAPPTTVPAAPATPAATQAPAAAAVAAPAAAGANALVLNVREDSWIEVRPAKGGAPLFSRLVKGGSTETVNVAGPVRLTVGNPSGVSATLRGTAVSLPAVPGKTLARVNLQ
ncbi:helix-turn-helix domain-containing protein [Massilia phyllosphaerae]|uniref:helix-turn-helix domain-containing protein n=1 Tax=Massilia phyllosphaerae TaxID=3106034 RepID=UPI002B1CB044|nr:helix-turn-helix domain-containing protein [Massilia sp. SGZ-792]